MSKVFLFFKNIVLDVWYFVSGFVKFAYVSFLTAFGRIRVSWYFPFISYDPKGYVITSVKIRKALSLLRPGDVVCRYFNGFIDGWFIPGRFTHTGVYVGKDEGFDTIIHALGSGVQKIDVIDFLRCDGFAILRAVKGEDSGKMLFGGFHIDEMGKHVSNCEHKETIAEKACRIAHGYLGYSYDFFFDICEDYKNQSEVQKRTKSLYCHEMTRSCFPDLDVPLQMPQIWHGMIRSRKKQFLAQSFFDSKDFKLIYDSDFSELRCDQK